MEYVLNFTSIKHEAYCKMRNGLRNGLHKGLCNELQNASESMYIYMYIIFTKVFHWEKKTLFELLGPDELKLLCFYCRLVLLAWAL